MITFISEGAANKHRPNKGRSGDSHVQADTQGVSHDRDNSSERKPLPKKIRRGSTGIIGAVAPVSPGPPQGWRHWMAGNRAPAQSATAGRVASAVRSPTTDSLHPVDDALRGKDAPNTRRRARQRLPRFRGSRKQRPSPFGAKPDTKPLVWRGGITAVSPAGCSYSHSSDGMQPPKFAPLVDAETAARIEAACAPLGPA